MDFITVDQADRVPTATMNRPEVLIAIDGYAAWRDADDSKAGPIAFAEKRAPQWKGR